MFYGIELIYYNDTFDYVIHDHGSLEVSELCVCAEPTWYFRQKKVV
jgi:hypothetical protein